MDMKKFLKNLLLRNRWSDYEMILQECSLGDPFQKLFAKFWCFHKHSFGEWGLLALYEHEENLKKSSPKLLVPIGSVVSVSDSWPGGCEFDPWLRRFFFQAYFRLSPLQKHVGKVVCGFGKKSCVSTGERKPGNTYASSTAMIWP